MLTCCPSSTSGASAAPQPLRQSDDSLHAMLANATLIVVATASRVSPPAGERTATFKVLQMLRGTSAGSITVGLPRSSSHASVIQPGKSYFLVLAASPHKGRFDPVDGLAGVLSYDRATETIGRFSAAVPEVPTSFSLNLAEAYLGTPIPTTTTTSAPPLPGACPPGCALPAVTDGITVLASSATGVAIVTMSRSGTSLEVDRWLQGGDKQRRGVYSSHSMLFDLTSREANVHPAESYVVFTSLFRGGSCLSALFSFDWADHTARFLTDHAGGNPLQMSNGLVAIPEVITLTKLRRTDVPNRGSRLSEKY